MNRMIVFGLIIALAGPAAGQTMYKCSDASGAVKFQQMPCSPTGGGETVPIKKIPTGVGSGLSDSAKDYMTDRDKYWDDKAKVQAEDSDSLPQHIENIKKEELAKECYSLKKRIHYIKRLEEKGAHVRQNSMMDDDSRDAIEQYKKKCGHWEG